MKKVLLMAFTVSVMLGACKKDKNEESKPPKDVGTFNLSKITYNDEQLMTFKYSNNQIIEATNTYYKDLIAYKDNGQIDTVINYSFGSPYRIKYVTYGSNNKIAYIACYSNANKTGLQETTTYTYDNFNRISNIEIIDGANKSIYSYGYNSDGNQTSYKRTYIFNSKFQWSKEITASNFDKKPNPFLTLPNFEYFFSNTYMSEYERLGVPATLGRNNIIEASGKNTIGTTVELGTISYGLKYDINNYINIMDYSMLVGGSLNVTYGFSYIKAE